MSPEKVWSTLEFYRLELFVRCPLRQMTREEYLSKSLPATVLLPHCRWMIQHCLEVFKPAYEKAMAALPSPDRYGIVPADDVIAARDPLEKAMRWLCYVQGVCNSVGVFSCDELRNHSREETEAQRYARLEKEHLGDPDLKTGIYAAKPDSQETTTIKVGPVGDPSGGFEVQVPKNVTAPPPRHGASSDGDWDAE